MGWAGFYLRAFFAAGEEAILDYIEAYGYFFGTIIAIILLVLLIGTVRSIKGRKERQQG